MVKRVSFSNEDRSLDEIGEWRSVVRDALNLFYSPGNPKYSQLFARKKPEEVLNERNLQIRELDLSSSFMLLATVEAAFQIDFQIRVQKKFKDKLSKKFRTLNKQKGKYVSLEEDILEAWKTFHPNLKKEIGLLKGAFKFRHWIAHGRYWTPKIGQYYDFTSVNLIAVTVLSKFPFK